MDSIAISRLTWDKHKMIRRITCLIEKRSAWGGEVMRIHRQSMNAECSHSNSLMLNPAWINSVHSIKTRRIISSTTDSTESYNFAESSRISKRARTDSVLWRAQKVFSVRWKTLPGDDCWELLNEYQNDWLVLFGSHCLDCIVWIKLFGSYYSDRIIWIILFGSYCLDCMVWIVLLR
jgi:hypothetical protein